MGKYCMYNILFISYRLYCKIYFILGMSPQSYFGAGGQGYGAGGGGGGYTDWPSNVRYAGGAGADGLVYIEWN